MSRKHVVILTGFGPFGEYTINASWEVVKEVQQLNVEKELGIELITREIPVSYRCVSQAIPHLWEKHQPTVIILQLVRQEPKESTDLFVSFFWASLPSAFLENFLTLGQNPTVLASQSILYTHFKITQETTEMSCLQLVIHLGVSGFANELTIETCAHNTGYQRKDVDGEMPTGTKCCATSSENAVNTKVDVHRVVEEVNSANIGVKATVSTNAGRSALPH